MPDRITLSRAAGWRKPPNTLTVDRSTPLGNPFRTGVHGTQAECVERFRIMLSGLICYSDPKITPGQQEEYLRNLRAKLPELRGKNLACWCKPGTPCHADVLIEVANGDARQVRTPDVPPARTPPRVPGATAQTDHIATNQVGEE